MRIQDLLRIEVRKRGWGTHHYVILDIKGRTAQTIGVWNPAYKTGCFLDYDDVRFETKVQFELYLLAQIRNHMMPVLEVLVEQGNSRS